MVYTVTFNPSLDYIISLQGFQMGTTNRTKEEQMLPGGKGINVSTVLQNLGIDNTALGFTAGFTGQEIERMVREIGFQCDFIRTKTGFSRINVKLKDYDGTEINGIGPVNSKGRSRKIDGKTQTFRGRGCSGSGRKHTGESSKFYLQRYFSRTSG